MELGLKSSSASPFRTILTFYVSPAQRWFYLFASAVSGLASILVLQPLLKFGNGWFWWFLVASAIIFAVFFVLLLRRFVLAFYLIKICTNNTEIKIIGGEINRIILWQTIKFIEVARGLSPNGKSLSDALIFAIDQDKEFKIFDQYTKSPHEILAVLQNFCNKSRIQVIFISGNK